MTFRPAFWLLTFLLSTALTLFPGAEIKGQCPPLGAGVFINTYYFSNGTSSERDFSHRMISFGDQKGALADSLTGDQTSVHGEPVNGNMKPAGIIAVWQIDSFSLGFRLSELGILESGYVGGMDGDRITSGSYSDLWNSPAFSSVEGREDLTSVSHNAFTSLLSEVNATANPALAPRQKFICAELALNSPQGIAVPPENLANELLKGLHDGFYLFFTTPDLEVALTLQDVLYQLHPERFGEVTEEERWEDDPTDAFYRPPLYPFLPAEWTGGLRRILFYFKLKSADENQTEPAPALPAWETTEIVIGLEFERGSFYVLHADAAKAVEKLCVYDGYVMKGLWRLLEITQLSEE